MTYREKTAWLTFVSMVIAYTLYFSLIATRPEGQMFDILFLFGIIASIQAVIVIIGHSVLAISTERSARAADERDRAIARRGGNIGYFVLMTGTILVGVVMPFDSSPWKIVNHALLALVIAEAVRHGIILLSYRRGWHG